MLSRAYVIDSVRSMQNDVTQTTGRRWPTRIRTLALLLGLGVPLVVVCLVAPAVAAALSAAATILAIGRSILGERS